MPLAPAELVRIKRDGGTLSPEQIDTLLHHVSAQRCSDAQIAAFCMAVFWRGLDDGEQAALTTGMARSGRMLRWDGLPGPVVDKHSTGGIGDKVSLILAPMLAALGCFVPMVSGRGLGHTGGTLDKLEAIPGYRTALDEDGFKRVVGEVGCAIVAATNALAPADKRFYAVRDVTATVESRPLIVASILSKKLAAGVGHLTLDVKVGSGAFLPSLDAARDLADNLVSVGNAAGIDTQAVLSDMNQCLGHSAGNALEVLEAIAALRDPTAADPRLIELCVVLAAMSLHQSHRAANVTEGLQQARAVLDNGMAAERFARMVTALGAPSDLLEQPGQHLRAADVTRSVSADEEGFVAAVDGRALGLTVIDLGGGRRLVEDRIDPRVGLSHVVSLGAHVAPGQPLAVVHAADEASAEAAQRAVRRAIRLAAEPPRVPAVVVERVSPPTEPVSTVRFQD